MLGTLLAAVIGGPFPLLCTPYTEKGEVDCAVLAKEARFVADCGANGVIWPAADDSLKLLTADEERRGLEAIVAAKPVVKTVFTGWGGRDWLYQYRRIGTRGVISQRPMYADLMVKIWRALESGSPEADDLFAKFMYLRNLDNVLPSSQMRGWNLYVLRKRGVFPNALSRVAKKGGGWTLEDLKLTPGQIAEIDARLKFAGIE